MQTQVVGCEFTFSRNLHHAFNLLGGITLLRNSVPKAVEVSSRLRRLRAWIECGCAAVSAVIAAYPLMTILRLYHDHRQTALKLIVTNMLQFQHPTTHVVLKVPCQLGSCVLTFFSDTYVTYTPVTVMFSL